MSRTLIEEELVRISRLHGPELGTGLERWRVLLDSHGPTVGDALADLLESRASPMEIELIMTALPDHPSPRARARLEALLLQEPWSVGPEDIVEALEAVGNRETVSVLVRALQHRDPPPTQSLRKKIARALGILGGTGSIDALRRLAGDTDPDVAEEAKAALKKTQR